MAHCGLSRKKKKMLPKLQEENFMDLVSSFKNVPVESNGESNAVYQQWTSTLTNSLAAIAVYKVAHLVFFFPKYVNLVLNLC